MGGENKIVLFDPRISLDDQKFRFSLIQSKDPREALMICYLKKINLSENKDKP